MICLITREDKDFPAKMISVVSITVLQYNSSGHGNSFIFYITIKFDEFLLLYSSIFRFNKKMILN